MHKAQVLICHHDHVAISKIEQNLASSEMKLHMAHDITEAYNKIEHEEPSYLIIAIQFARAPEFNIFSAALNQLSVKCIFWDFEESEFFISNTNDVSHIDDTFSLNQLSFVLQGENLTSKRKENHRESTVSDVSRCGRRIILLGASTGGIDALAQVIRHFTPDCPPILIVQHTGDEFAKSLGRHLNGLTEACVVHGQDQMPLTNGMICLAPNNTQHLVLCGRNGRRIKLLSDGPINGHRPSIDALFNSAVPFAKHVSAALLTGMGRDGAFGLKSLRSAGAHTIAQDKDTSVVYGMPRIAATLGAAVEQLPITQIGPALLAAKSNRAVA